MARGSLLSGVPSWGLAKKSEAARQSPEKTVELLTMRDPEPRKIPSEIAIEVANGVPNKVPNNVAPVLEFPNSPAIPIDLWHDVFVERPLPWSRFLQSAVLHTAAVALIWTISLSWIRQQKILTNTAFDRSSLVTYTPEEYLPPLDTGRAKPLQAPRKADPVYAKQPILSVPPEADNRSQTIVVPPNLKLDHDVPLPNIVATGAIVPMVPLDATSGRLRRAVSPDVPQPQVVAPTPDVDVASNRMARTAMKSDVVAPPPEVATKGHVSLMNIGPSDVVAPTPQLSLAEQHSPGTRGGGRPPGASAQPVAPPPSVASANSNAGGRLVALGIHPITPTGPVPVPSGNRRGAFAANPQGKPGASGAPDSVAAKSVGQGGFHAGKNGSLPSGLRVGAVDPAGGTGEIASAGTAPTERSNARVAAPVSDDKITDVDRKVFGGKRVYGRTLNMPNLNSATGSWVIKFAELNGEQKEGDLLEPVATEKPDPGYPLALMRANVHGVVTLYAVIHSDGRVSDIRVLESPDDRLDSYATKALAGWKFLPAERAGKKVALEAVVMIPFKVRNF
jgi:TonB family protein